MRILTPGINPVDLPQRATCPSCKAVIEFTAREVTLVPDQRDGDFYDFKCLCCGGRITRQVHMGNAHMGNAQQGR